MGKRKVIFQTIGVELLCFAKLNRMGIYPDRIHRPVEGSPSANIWICAYIQCGRLIRDHVIERAAIDLFAILVDDDGRSADAHEDKYSRRMPREPLW